MKYLLSIFLFLGLLACNPVKQVFKDPVKFGKVRDEVFRQGLCLNDTIVVEDTVITTILKDTTIVDTLRLEKKVGVKYSIDTVFKNGVHLKIDTTGLMTLKVPKSIEYRDRKIKSYTRDNSRENILLKDINELRQSNFLLQEVNKKNIVLIKDLQKQIRFKDFLLKALLIGLLAFSCYRVYKNFFK